MVIMKIRAVHIRKSVGSPVPFNPLKSFKSFMLVTALVVRSSLAVSAVNRLIMNFCNLGMKNASLDDHR
jgi:hypothetical protein